MATLFIVVVLAIFVANSIIMRSQHKSPDDPEGVLDAESGSQPSSGRVLQPWEIALRQKPVAETESPADEHPVRSEPPVPMEHAETELIARIPGDSPGPVPDDEAVTQVLPRVPAGYGNY